MKIACSVEYLGTNYYGYQEQPDHITVQSVLENAISSIANEQVKIFASGRTDTGVHALGQIFHFESSSLRDSTAWVRGVNSLLPTDIKIKWSTPVADDFHARFSAISREYQYLLYNSKVSSPVWKNISGWFFAEIDEKILITVLRNFIGIHDFSSFRSSECQSKNPIKEIYEAKFEKKNDFFLFFFKGDGFLHHQIRNMMSVILDIASKKKNIDYLDYLFDIKDRKEASNTFSPNGLFLSNIEYDSKFNLPKIYNQVI